MEDYYEVYEGGEEKIDPSMLYAWKQLSREDDIFKYLSNIIEINVPDELKPKLKIITENVRFISTSRISEKDRYLYHRRISNLIDELLESIPPKKITFNLHIILETIELLLHLAVDRAIDGFERKIEATHISEYHVTQETGGARPPKRGGFFRKLGGVFG